ncbi:MAG: hypothetical protein AMJ69_06880 [Gammaproteobacteria bacterium SG8_47]|nr:MAG: hypothetical protein AMJ69_06880 [Gammaproteobacteria bacterium SG8_47]
MTDNKDREIKELRLQLKADRARVRQNQDKLARFQALELDLLAATGVAQLLELVLSHYRTEFKLDLVTLALVDTDYELRRVLADGGINITEWPSLQLHEDAAILDELTEGGRQVVLAPFDNVVHGGLLPALSKDLASVALLPLLRGETLIGTLNVGSIDGQRFVPGTATDFLERLAAVVAIALENAFNGERLKRLGLIDPLTGVHNRRYFDQRLHEEVVRGQRLQQPLSCLFLDLDHFKCINDTYGHHLGDVVLQEVAATIRSQLRGSDTLGRLGGEEFAALLSQADAATAVEIAERIRHRVAALSLADADGLNVTLSIGVSTLEQQPRGADPLLIAKRFLERADQALYRAKDNGRNRVEVDDGTLSFAVSAERE